MVVESRDPIEPATLDLGYLALFVGLRMNERVLEKMVAMGFSETRQSHGYVIQHLIEAERTITELASRMEVTQQAASKMVAEMARRGIVELIVSEDRRAKRVRLSTQGWESVKQARKIRGDLEKRLEKVLGAGAYQESKAALLKALDALGGVERVRTRRLRMAQ